MPSEHFRTDEFFAKKTVAGKADKANERDDDRSRSRRGLKDTENSLVKMNYEVDIDYEWPEMHG